MVRILIMALMIIRRGRKEGDERRRKEGAREIDEQSRSE